MGDPATANLLDRQSLYSPGGTNCGSETANNGNIYSITDNLAPHRQDFTYDSLNRLKTAATTPSTLSQWQYNHTYNYDSFGNMVPQDNLHANLDYSIDPATNRLMSTGASISYYPGGELATANGHSFLQIADGYLRCVDSCTTGSYLYNGQGQRTLSVRNDGGDYSRYSWSQNVYLNGQPMAELHVDSAGGTPFWTDYIYANGQKIAKVDSPTTGPQATNYYLADHLGTTQLELSSTGTVLWQGEFTPFGQELLSGWTTNYLGNQPADGTNMHYKFTGKERDAESGLDYFGARYYASSMGRWMSPDWSATGEPVPYAKLDDPQSLNLYGYVGNNPLNRDDPDGHQHVNRACHKCTHPLPSHGGHRMSDERKIQIIKGIVGGAAVILAAPEILGAAAAAATVNQGLAVGGAALAATGTGVNAATNLMGGITGTKTSEATDMVTNVTNPVAGAAALATGSAERGAQTGDLATVAGAAADVATGKGVRNPAEVGNSIGGAIDAVKGYASSVINYFTPVPPPPPPPPPRPPQ